MSGDVLDYSSGWPAPASIRDSGYAGVVRYVGTPGRSKNLTRAEVRELQTAGVPIGLVYESTAGWMLGGGAAGVAAARAVLTDPALVSTDTYRAPRIRCVYFACDIDVTGESQMAAIQECLDGAASVFGRAQVGVYGEADVIDDCVPAHAAYAWQTRAWSAGRVAKRVCLLQEIGYVQVGGVQCDRNTVLKPDWGQDTYGGLTMDQEVRAAFDALGARIDAHHRLVTVGDAPDNQLGPDGKPIDKGGHPWNLERLTARVDTLAAKVDLLAAGGGAVDTDALAAKVADLLAQRLAQ